MVPRPARRLFIAVVAALCMSIAWNLALAPLTAAQPRRPSSTLPPGASIQLGPTYPTHTGDIPTVEVGGLGGSYHVNIPIDNCGNPCWVDQGFPIDTYIVEAGHLGLVTPDTCSTAPGAIKVKTALNGAGGKIFLTDSFNWPAAAASTAQGSPWYVLCVHVEVPSTSAFYPKPDYASGTAADEGTNAVYKVICDQPRTTTLSATRLSPGQILTVTGRNWVPTYADVSATQVSMNVYQYLNGPYYTFYGASQSPQVDASGNWTATVPIGAGAPPGLYSVCAGSQEWNCGAGSIDGHGTIGVPFEVVAPTATATATPSAAGATGGNGRPSAGAATPTVTTESATPSPTTDKIVMADGRSTAPVATGVGIQPSRNTVPGWLSFGVPTAALGLTGATLAVVVTRRRRTSVMPPSADAPAALGALAEQHSDATTDLPVS